jgi:hypothetical protein
MRPSVLQVLVKHALMISDDLSDRLKTIKEETLRLLCTICTVKTNRFYIPGETNIVERLRKESFDKGIFAALTHIYQILNNKGGEKFRDIKQYIQEKVLNLIELNDLVYHSQVIEQLIELIKTG